MSDRNNDDSSVEITASVKLKLDTLPPPTDVPKTCIYKIHERLRKINENAYTPAGVAIGPYHHDKPNLQAMEEYKLRYVNAILARWPEIKLEEYVNKLSELEGSARECYSETINLNTEKFIEMMLVDGLFIVEFLLRLGNVVRKDEEDPIFNIHWILPCLAQDMALLENQIPMVVLWTLFDLIKAPNYTINFLTYVAVLFLASGFRDTIHRDFNVRDYHESNHLLDLLAKSFGASFPQVKPTSGQRKFIRSVTKLQQAGVKLKKGNSNCFLDIKFNNGNLEIPPLYIQGSMESLLRNLIALEQCSYGHDTRITSYALLMDDLIDSADDVALLCDHEIIKNGLGDNKVVATLFNKLCVEAVYDGFYYTDLCDKVNTYYNTPCHKFMSALRRDYFSTPLKFLSIAIVAFLSIVTVLEMEDGDEIDAMQHGQGGCGGP